MHTGKTITTQGHTRQLPWNLWTGFQKGGRSKWRHALPFKAPLSPQPFHQHNTNGKRIHAGFQNPLAAQRLTEHCSDRELFFKLTLQHNISPPSQLGSAPTLTLKFLSNPCKSNPESLKIGKNCYFLQILAQCTEMEQAVTGLKV